MRWPAERVGEDPLLHIFGVDPGVTSGVAYLRCRTRALITSGWTGTVFDRGTQWWVTEVGSEAGEVRHVTQLVDIMREVWLEVDQEMGDRFLVVFEDFLLRMANPDRSLLAPVRITAAFRDRMRSFRYPFRRVTPSDSKGVVTDARLRGWNMWVEGEDHVRDALRVAVMGARDWASSKTARDYIEDMQYRPHLGLVSGEEG